MNFTIVIILLILILLICIYLTFEYSLLMPSVKGLPILMYHKVSTQKNDSITICVDKLEKQFNFFKRKNYNTISFVDLKEHLLTDKKLPSNPMIITFDDGYLNNYKLAFPLLKKFKFKATVFLPVAYIGKKNEWDEGQEEIVGFNIIKELSESGLIDFGLHSYRHQSYENMKIEDIENDLKLCIKILDENAVEYIKVLAYPFGGFPRRNPKLNKQMKEIFGKHNIDFALRIGSRINKFPFKDNYELKRINMRGSDKIFEFKIKMKKGRTRLF